MVTTSGANGAAPAPGQLVTVRNRMWVASDVIQGSVAAGDAATLTGLAAQDPTEIFARPLALLARPNDIALALAGRGDDPAILAALRTAHERGLLTVALVGYHAGPLADLTQLDRIDHLLQVMSDDPCVIKEVQVTTYHVLWELVHVFLDAPSEAAL